jgi:oligo-1,6-glucosidase
VFQFDIVDVGMGKVFKFQTTPRNYKLTDLKRAIARTQSLVSPDFDGWTTAFMENHDQARSISRFGNDSTPSLARRSGKMLALFNTTMSGTLFVYQGQELGYVNLPRDFSINDYKDLESRNYYQMVAERSGGDEKELDKAMKALQYLARDHARSPMQWNGSLPSGGFTSQGVEPWMKLNPSTTTINAEQQLGDPDSVLSFWKNMLDLRKQHRDLLVHGKFVLIDSENEAVFSFTKEWQDHKALVVCNFSDTEQAEPKVGGEKRLLISSIKSSKENILEAWEGRVYLLG